MADVHEKKELLARQGTKLTVGKGDVVWAYSGSTIDAENGSTVYAFKGAKVYAISGSTVHAYEGSKVWASGTATVRVAEQPAYVEGGKDSTIQLSSGIDARVKVKAHVKVEEAEQVFIEAGWSGHPLSVIANEGATIFGGVGNTLYVERGAIYL
jgi:hypothetical protein